ncbi:MAG: hypothetical protein KGL43_26005 [Burkholderiales bacterium]|nr:hypothetical protein [Burkholderiales bacterium]
MSPDLHEVEHERRAEVALDQIRAGKLQHQRESRRPKALTARDAIVALQFECTLIWTCAGNILNGEELTEADFERITLAMSRINAVIDEVAR